MLFKSFLENESYEASPLESGVKNKDLTICVHGVFKVSAHPVISVLLLHGVWVEESDDGARVRLPKLSVNLAEQQQGDKHLQVVEVV